MDLPTPAADVAAKTSGEYTVAVVIIARDEARCISRCVESIRPWIADVLVVDTGSVDDTVELAREAGARTGFFQWRDDFASARNAALDEAAADWHVILDADEVILAGGDQLEQLRREPPVTVGMVEIVSTFALGSELTTEREEQMRVLPGHVRYTGTIHNQPSHNLPIRHVRTTIGHDGYEPEQIQGKFARREAMLRNALAESPSDYYLRFQLARILEIQERWQEAAVEYRRVDVIATRHDPWHHLLVVQMAHTLAQNGQALDALDVLAPFEQQYARSSDFHFVLGNVLLDVAVAYPSQAEQVVPACLSAWQRAEALGEEIPFLGHVTGRGSFMARHNLEVLQHDWQGALKDG